MEATCFLKANSPMAKLANNDVQPPLSPAEAELKGFEVISQNGNPAHGTVLYLGQTHGRPETKDSPSIQEYVLISQQGILDELIQLKPTHVFLEGVCSSHIKQLNDLKTVMGMIIGLVFRGYQPGGELTGEQKTIIHSHDAATVYAMLYPTVVLHETTTEELSQQHEDYFNAHRDELFSGKNEPDPIIHAEREKLAMRFVLQFLKKDPQQVALIFGANHNFSHCCADSESQPQFYFKNLSSTHLYQRSLPPLLELSDEQDVHVQDKCFPCCELF